MYCTLLPAIRMRVPLIPNSSPCLSCDQHISNGPVINPCVTRYICVLNYLLSTGYCVLFSYVCKIRSSPRGSLSQSPPSPSRGALRDRRKCEPSLVGLPPTRQGCVMKRAAGHRGPAPPVRVRRTYGVKRYTSSPTGIQMPLAVRAIG